MMLLGIEDQSGLVYERPSVTGVGIGVWPSPILIPANILPDSAEQLEPAPSDKYSKDYLLFREDSFDPVSRTRRGRFYTTNQHSQDWMVRQHPVLPNDVGINRKQLSSYHSFSAQQKISSFGTAQPLIILGLGKNTTVWSLISIENTATSDEWVTLRMRQSFGALPRLREGAIPDSGKANVIKALGILSEDLHRAGPASVIDRAREAVTAILSSYLQEHNVIKPGKDIGGLIKSLIDFNKSQPEGKRKNVVCHAAEIIRLFHSRGKTAVQERLQVPPLREQDAELAVQCVSTILRDLEWADWVGSVVR